MKIQIHSLIDKGIYNSERIALKATESCNLKFFCIHKTKILSSGSFYNKPQYTYWFTPLEVKAGDWIVLYTGNGNASTKNNEDGSTSYFLFWGIENTILTDSVDTIVLAELNSWETKMNE